MSFLARNNGAGVDLFFVLSGFLITGILYESRDQPRYFRNFYARRTLRIFPLYYATLFAVSGAKLLVPNLFALQAVTGRAQFANLTYTSNFLIAAKGWSAEPTYLGHFWSLAVEEQFYILWPFVVIRLGATHLRTLCVAGIGAAFILRVALLWLFGFEAAYTLLPARMDALLVGGAIALQSRTPKGLPSWIRSRWLLGGLAAAFVLDQLAAPTTMIWVAIKTSLHFSITSLGFGALLVAATTGKRLAAMMRFWPFRFFGKYSYALYVVHVAIIIALPPLFSKVTESIGLGVVRPSWLTTGLLSLTASVLAALLTWRFLESPFLKLKKRFGPPDSWHVAGGSTSN